ncbi:unnamed protein product [Owenia fusiformis]|uniref:Uncharacterized protein n=2 Tax=Owenia fusiformis TaxID=6347 RepID=A0A8J1UF04_OWEFU|nr:unnamed protein product [Owenia fusiformis]
MKDFTQPWRPPAPKVAPKPKVAPGVAPKPKTPTKLVSQAQAPDLYRTPKDEIHGPKPFIPGAEPMHVDHEPLQAKPTEGVPEGFVPLKEKLELFKPHPEQAPPIQHAPGHWEKPKPLFVKPEPEKPAPKYEVEVPVGEIHKLPTHAWSRSLPDYTPRAGELVEDKPEDDEPVIEILPQQKPPRDEVDMDLGPIPQEVIPQEPYTPQEVPQEPYTPERSQMDIDLMSPKQEYPEHEFIVSLPPGELPAGYHKVTPPKPGSKRPSDGAAVQPPWRGAQPPKKSFVPAAPPAQVPAPPAAPPAQVSAPPAAPPAPAPKFTTKAKIAPTTAPKPTPMPSYQTAAGVPQKPLEDPGLSFETRAVMKLIREQETDK